jgi:hypothetical protein
LLQVRACGMGLFRETAAIALYFGLQDRSIV